MLSQQVFLISSGLCPLLFQFLWVVETQGGPSVCRLCWGRGLQIIGCCPRRCPLLRGHVSSALGLSLLLKVTASASTTPHCPPTVSLGDGGRGGPLGLPASLHLFPKASPQPDTFSCFPSTTRRCGQPCDLPKLEVSPGYATEIRPRVLGCGIPNLMRSL